MASFHAIIIEGMGRYDHRDPKLVAKRVIHQLKDHWIKNPPIFPLVVMTQGDPFGKTGISAITPLVADHFKISRALVCLDEEFDSFHSRNADRENVFAEFKYSQLLGLLNHFHFGLYTQIEEAIDEEIAKKNSRRAHLGKRPLRKYYRVFALLQEVVKAVCKLFCSGISIIHTSSQVHEFSVSSFYKIGLDLGIISSTDVISYGDLDIFTN